MNYVKSILTGFGSGAALMYLADPDRGRRRRALIRDKFSRGVHESRSGMEKTWRDLQHRAQGMAAGVRTFLRRRQTDDDILVARVRSRIGRAVSHPHAISVRVERGRVILEGPVLAAEADRLVSAVSSVPGVKHVESRLDLHETADNVPGLQGGGSPPRQRFELFQSNWTPAVRMLAGFVGGGLVVRGARRGGVLGMAQALLGTGMLLRAGTNRELRRILGMDREHFAFDVQKTMTIRAPVEEVFRFWTNLENLPRFMTHLREVRDLGNRRSHWVAAGPGGVPVSWDAEVTELIPNRVVAWRSAPGSQVENSGTVRFDANPDRSTRITIRMSYTPPAGVLGHAVASLFGADPKSEIDADLVRLKSLIEFGKTRGANRETVRREEFGSAMPSGA